MGKNRKIALLVMLMFALTFITPATYASNISDITGHWAEASINEIISQGIINGYPDGTFKPEGKITRAEFATLIVKGFKLSNSGGKTFTDTANHWAKDAIAVANASGIVSGYSDTTFGPNDPITKEQMAVMIVKAANLTTSANAKTFADSQNIAAWAKGAVAIASSNNLISGYAADNTFKPKNNTTRAEAAVVLSKSLNTTPIIPPKKEEPVKADYSLIEKSGTYGPKTGSETVAGNVTVKAKGITLQNLIIKGDLIIAKEVGNGDVTLNNIKVGGKTYIRGGGKDSVYINGGEYRDVIVESTATGAVRIVATNAAGLQVVISENAKGEEIILNGEFKNITINADDVKITTQADTTIGEVKVASGLKDVNIELAKDSTVKEMVLDSKADVKGEGKTEKASGTQANNSNFQTAPSSTNTGGGSGSSSGTTTVAVSAISVTGNSVVGNTLTATTTPAEATVAYQWQKADTVDGTYTNIAGATSKTYVVVAGDAGKYIKVKGTGTGSYTGTITSTATSAVVGMFATPMDYEAPGGLLGKSNTVSLFGTTFTDAAASQDVNNWTIDTGTTNLKVKKITRTGNTSATIDYDLKNAGQGTGVGTITIKAKTAAVTASVDTNAASVAIAAPPVTYKVTFSVVGENGRLVATVDSVAIDSEDYIEAGKNVVFTASPDNVEYRVKEWKVDGAVVAGNTTNTLKVDGLDATKAVTVEFEVIKYEYTIIVADDNNNPIVGVSIAIADKTKATDEDGKAEFNLTAGQHDITVVKDGYETYARDIQVDSGGGEITIRLAKNEDQAAPKGLAGVAPTSESNNDGKITGTTIAMEYKLASAADSAYVACLADATTGLVAGDYVVRLAAKEGFNAGATVAIIVPAYAAPGPFAVTLAGDAVRGTDYILAGAADLNAVPAGTTLEIVAITAITVNGEKIAANGSKNIVIATATTITINKVPDSPISIPAIGGVTVPVWGAAPVTAITETDQYTGTVSWLPAIADGKFAASTIYTATIMITAKPGYTSTNVEENFFKVTGAQTTNHAYSSVVTAEFPMTKNDDAKLTTIKYTLGGNSIEVPNFNSETLVYNVVLPAGTTQVPNVEYERSDEYAIGGLTNASSLPGVAKIIVTATDGTTRTYTINFTVAVVTSIDVSNASGSTYNIPNSGFVGKVGNPFIAIIKDQHGAAMLDQGVTWSIAGATEDQMKIDGGGKLEIYDKATPATFNVIATSNTNNTIKGTMAITLVRGSIWMDSGTTMAGPANSGGVFVTGPKIFLINSGTYFSGISVTVSKADAGNWTLGGTLTAVTEANGYVTFNNLTATNNTGSAINDAKLVFAAEDFTGCTSGLFTVPAP